VVVKQNPKQVQKWAAVGIYINTRTIGVLMYGHKKTTRTKSMWHTMLNILNYSIT